MSKPLSHRLMISCCVCKKEIRERNYKRHLKDSHPDEDTNNLRGYSQLSVGQLFGFKRQRVEEDEVSVGEAAGVSALEDDNENVENNNREGFVGNRDGDSTEAEGFTRAATLQSDDVNNNLGVVVNEDRAGNSTAAGRVTIDVDRVAKKFDCLKLQVEDVCKDRVRTVVP